MQMEAARVCPHCGSTNVGAMPTPGLLGITSAQALLDARFLECYKCGYYWKISHESPGADTRKTNE